MNATLSSGDTYLAPRPADEAAVADGPVSDDARRTDLQALVVGSDTDGRDGDVMGHHLPVSHARNVYVHRHGPDDAEVIPFADTPLGDAA